MSGHNKWSKIKRKKELTDAKKAKVFSKLIKNIELAAQKGTDPQTNSDLRMAISQAKSSSVPNSNIERVIKRASGKDKLSAKLEEIYYEAYGPGGVAILIKAITDNKNRAVADIKHILSKNSSHLADKGSVRWQFGENNKPNFFIELSEKDNASLSSLLEKLEENEDVQNVFTNIK